MSGAVVTQIRIVAEREDRRPPAAVRVEDPVPYGKHAGVNAMQAAGANAAEHCLARQTETPELIVRDHAALTTRDRRNHMIWGANVTHMET